MSPRLWLTVLTSHVLPKSFLQNSGATDDLYTLPQVRSARMVSLKLPLFKQKIARKPSTKSSQIRVSNVSVQRKISSRKKTLPSVLSTLRASSTIKRLTAGRNRELGFLTAPAGQPSQKRRIIHVATLNYGPFDDDISTISATYIPRPIQLNPTPKEEGRKAPQSAPLPAAISQSSPTETDTESFNTACDMTFPSVYSADSWTEVEHPTVGPAIVVWRAADSVEDEGEEALQLTQPV